MKYLRRLPGLLFYLLLVSCSNEFSFVQVTDPQFGFISENKGVAEEAKLYAEAVNKINETGPSAVIITGDLVHERTNNAQWDEFLKITSNLKSVKVCVLPGNHDIGQEPTLQDIETFRQRVGNDRFSFTYRKCAFIGFNSGLIKAMTPDLEEEQFKWLEGELTKAAGAKQVFLFCHHPFFIDSPEEPEEYFNINPEVRSKYLSMFRKYGVDAVFAGHLHRNAVASAGNMMIITTSSAGKQLGRDLPGFRLVKVTREGFSHEYITTVD